MYIDQHDVLVVLGSLLGTAIITASFIMGGTVGASIRDFARTQLGPADETIRVTDLAKLATYDTLMPVLAQRPAPLQVTWLGFPGTTGAPFIDYLIGDPLVTPLQLAPHYSEKLAQLPLTF